jgi:hypothetical protein
MSSVLSINIFFIGEDLPQKKKWKNGVNFFKFFIMLTWMEKKSPNLYIWF